MTIPAQVPGNVIADLHRAGVVPDPYFGLNSAGLRIWEFVDFEYRTGFRAPETEPGERLELVLEGRRHGRRGTVERRPARRTRQHVHRTPGST